MLDSIQFTLFPGLPLEISDRTVSFLDVRTQARIKAVCKRFFNAVLGYQDRSTNGAFRWYHYTTIVVKSLCIPKGTPFEVKIQTSQEKMALAIKLAKEVFPNMPLNEDADLYHQFISVKQYCNDDEIEPLVTKLTSMLLDSAESILAIESFISLFPIEGMQYSIEPQHYHPYGFVLDLLFCVNYGKKEDLCLLKRIVERKLGLEHAKFIIDGYRWFAAQDVKVTPLFKLAISLDLSTAHLKAGMSKQKELVHLIGEAIKEVEKLSDDFPLDKIKNPSNLWYNHPPLHSSNSKKPT